ncbi:hypothetical protein ORJ66_21275 [Pseudoalteromonas tunicata]|uniref:hypothetical protein n=1 Tax=Pseudoalteromonas tunicata TaxID=314281 RepID=UPI00273E5C03|nr:hypothetical protein [Pseudoalteromonas tunicata]MDP5215579.1 hypothetical protein [Pseudoalteromonas tunicata]
MIASSEEYIEALLKLRDSKRLRNTKFLEMLKAQYSMPNHTITATQLAEAVGFQNYNATNLQYGTLGKEIAGFLSYIPPKRKNGESIWFWVLSSGNDASDETMNGHYEFVMRPELVQALETMKWVK